MKELSAIIAKNEPDKINSFFSFNKIEEQYRFNIIKSSFNQIQYKTYGCNNLFLVVKESLFDGTLIHRKDNFRLKHLSSDVYFDLAKYAVAGH